MFRIVSVVTFLLVFCVAGAQPVYDIRGIARSDAGMQHREIIESRPKEVLFGIHITGSDVLFQMTNETWFRKIFARPGDALTADLVARKDLECGAKPTSDRNWYSGTVLKPVPYEELLRRLKRYPDGTVEVRIGTLPPALRRQEIEGNLVIIRNREVSFYTNFTHIDESLWELLDMGLYTDSLLRNQASA
ncbi:MAG: hypothetical protein EOP50_18220, partial [Sphingobacteriales bacterium]